MCVCVCVYVCMYVCSCNPCQIRPYAWLHTNALRSYRPNADIPKARLGFFRNFSGHVCPKNLEITYFGLNFSLLRKSHLMVPLDVVSGQK